MHHWAVVGISPSEFDGVKFGVAVVGFAGCIGNQDWRKHERIVGVGCVRLYAEHVVRCQELVYPVGFIGSERSGFDLVGFGCGLIVELGGAVDNRRRAFH